MNTLKNIVTVVLVTFCFSSVTVKAQVSWDFDNGNDHGFTYRSLIPATPAADDPNTAGDESLTGGWEVGNPNNLPEAGVAGVIGSPAEMFGLLPGADPDHGNRASDGTLDYLVSPQRVGDEDNGSVNTFNLNFHGDFVHKDYNDQIATSPPVLLGDNALLSAWSWGGGGTIAPEFDSNPDSGYATGSCGIAVLSAADNSLLASVFTNNKGERGENTLDLSDFTGQTVIIEVVDCFEGGWGWIAVDEIQITNATLAGTDVAGKPSATPITYALMQNFPNPFNPSTKISFSLKTKEHTTLTVYNAMGQLVATLSDQDMNVGTYHVTFDARELPSGVYFYQIRSGEFTQVKKMMLMK